MTLRHFRRDDDLSPAELGEVLDLADAMKADPAYDAFIIFHDNTLATSGFGARVAAD